MAYGNFGFMPYRTEPINVPSVPVPAATQQMETLTQRPSRQTAGGYPLLNQTSTAPMLPSTSGSAYLSPYQPPSAPVPGMETIPGFDPGVQSQITALLSGYGLTPEQRQAIEVLTGIGQEASAAGQAREMSKSLRLGRSGSSLEGQNIAAAAAAGTRATQESVLPILQDSARMAQENRTNLASFLTDIGKLDAANKRDAIIRYTDRLVQAGQFDIANLTQLRTTMAQLVQQEVESLRAKGLSEQQLAQEKEIRLRELDQRLKEIELNAKNAQAQTTLDARIRAAIPVTREETQLSPFIGRGYTKQVPTGQYTLPTFQTRPF